MILDDSQGYISPGRIRERDFLLERLIRIYNIFREWSWASPDIQGQLSFWPAQSSKFNHG